MMWRVEIYRTGLSSEKTSVFVPQWEVKWYLDRIAID